ncbi:ROK family protein [Niabella beijingensis]|uniref:ROK family protein n=1 Tax=Niabella beijingensis TaxID=2872700 RepID=UPI001CBE21EC|nr:ROK family protein [Niabella beijingensis]MBZ4191945.1 ROK family protein [Niabella beijingensis]
MKRKLVAGVDIGGSHITAALIDPFTKTIIATTRTRRMVDAAATATTLLEAWAGTIVNCFAAADQPVGKIGVAMPGPFDYEKGISYIRGQHKFEALYQVNIKKELAGRLGILPKGIVFTNDAECQLKGEMINGAGKGLETALGLTIGTGLGSAVAIQGKVKDAGLWQSPFKETIAEEYLSAQWFRQRYFELTGKEARNVREIAKEAEADGRVETVFSEFGANLGSFLAAQLRKHKTKTVILGGNIARAHLLFLPSLQQLLQQQRTDVSIRIAALWEDAGLIGAVSHLLTGLVM